MTDNSVNTAQTTASTVQDTDKLETREWMDALSAVIEAAGPERAHFLLEELLEHARQSSIDMPFSANTAYVNTLEPAQEAHCPGNIEIEERLRAYMRWNAMAMVVKANRHHPVAGSDLGGHIGSFASLAHMFGAGFNHFWHAESENHGGDCLYIQGHVSPGVYARAYLEGRLTEEQLLNFRQEVDGKGLSSYPHPKLMPEFWQFQNAFSPAQGFSLGGQQDNGRYCRQDDKYQPLHNHPLFRYQSSVAESFPSRSARGFQPSSLRAFSMLHNQLSARISRIF